MITHTKKEEANWENSYMEIRQVFQGAKQIYLFCPVILFKKLAFFQKKLEITQIAGGDGGSHYYVMGSKIDM